MKMTRQELDDHLVDYLYDELPAADARRFEEGLVDHPDLQAEVAAHQRTSSLFGSLEPEPMPVGLLDGVMREARLAAAPAAQARPGFFAWLLELMMQPAMATAMLFFVVAGTGWFLVRGEGVDSASRTAGKVAMDDAHAPSVAEAAPAEVAPPAATATPEQPLVASAEEVKDLGNGARAKLLEVEEHGEAPSGLEVASGLARADAPAPAPAADAAPAKQAETGSASGSATTGMEWKTREALDVAAAPRAQKKAAKKATLNPVSADSYQPGTKQVAGVDKGSLRGNSEGWYAGGQEDDAPARRLKLSQESKPRAAAEPAPTTSVADGDTKNVAKTPSDMARAYEKRAETEGEAARADDQKAREQKAQDQEAQAERSARQSEEDRRQDAAKAAKALLTQYETHVRKGDVGKARKVLDELAKIPGYEQDAKKKRVALESEQVKRSGTASKKRAKKKASKSAGADESASDRPDPGYTGKSAPAKKATTAY